MAPTPLNARDMAASLALGLVVPAQASEAPRVEPIIVVTAAAIATSLEREC
jgi:hypothetical protein